MNESLRACLLRHNGPLRMALRDAQHFAARIGCRREPRSGKRAAAIEPQGSEYCDRKPQGTQPPASSDIHVGNRKQAAVAFSGRPGTNRLHAIVKNPPSPVRHAAVSD